LILIDLSNWCLQFSNAIRELMYFFAFKGINDQDKFTLESLGSP